MNRSVLCYLENSAELYPQKTALLGSGETLTYGELRYRAAVIGSELSRRIERGEGVGVYMEKDSGAVCAFFGIVYAGGFYCALNTELPLARLAQIQEVLKPRFIITTAQLRGQAREIFGDVSFLDIEELTAGEPDYDALELIRRRSIDTDPLYVNFTSGSTGTPKGIVVSHRSVIDFIDCFTDIFSVTERDVIANQAPFDFDVSVKDIYSAMKTGATLAIVPRRLFSAPTELTDFLCDNRVTTMIWAVSALSLISAFHCLDYRVPETVNKILFSGEVMPYKVLKNFQKHLPDAMYVNLYGPTEITCNCTYHILEKERDYSGGIPIGRAFPNEDVFLLGEDNTRITEAGVTGEICVRGTALALGYYRAPEQNRAHFVQNPLNGAYPETVYRTGDLGTADERGELSFCGRRDFQIKYMGHRIELEEIEREMSAVDGVELCCCIFDEKRSRLRGFYVGSIAKDELHQQMKEKLPAFMVPGILRQVTEMPLTKNGKIDRKRLSEEGGR